MAFAIQPLPLLLAGRERQVRGGRGEWNEAATAWPASHGGELRFAPSGAMAAKKTCG